MAPATQSLQAALDHFLEAASVAAKWRTLDPLVSRTERKVAVVMKRQLQAFLRGFAQLRGRIDESRLQEALSADDWVAVWERVAAASTERMFDPLQAAMRAALERGATETIADVGVNIAFNLRHPRAEAYLLEHGYGLISQIDGTTRGNLATIINEGIREGWSYNRIAREITSLYSFMGAEKPQAHIDSRAHLIAVTEIGNAYEAGSALIVRDLQDAGLQMEKKWLTVGDARVSDGCRNNQVQGWIPFAQSFSSGHQHPLRFPGCRCTTLYQRKQA
jgi:hypothetical protein